MVSEVTNANADDFLGVSDVLVENMVRDCFAKRWAFLMVHNLWNMLDLFALFDVEGGYCHIVPDFQTLRFTVKKP